MGALAGRGDLLRATDRMSVLIAAEEVARASPPMVLDVRTAGEWNAGHIAGSVNLPLNHLQERMGEVPRDRRIAVHCEGGYRSSIAASLLHQEGITNVAEIAGGLAAWKAARLPL